MTVDDLMSLFRKDSFSPDLYMRQYRIEDFKNIIREIVIKHRLELAELEAKVYTYERIIENSNFAPILKRKIKEVDKDVSVKEL